MKFIKVKTIRGEGILNVDKINYTAISDLSDKKRNPITLREGECHEKHRP